VKVKPFATKQNLLAEIGNDPKADFLAKFERGGTKRPREGARSPFRCEHGATSGT